MPSRGLEKENNIHINSVFLNDQINRLVEQTIPKFNRVIKYYVYLSIIFFLCIVGEIGFLISFLPFLIKSTLLAFSLALVFLTFFSYFIIRLYLKTKKPEQLLEIKEEFLVKVKEILNYHPSIPEHHLALANACAKFSSALEGKEYSYYKKGFSRWFKMAMPAMEKFSSFWHWQDVFEMRELLLTHAIDEHIQLVRYAPTDLEVHAALANAYVTLSTLYVRPDHEDAGEDNRWPMPESYLQLLEKKYRATAKRAIEEFKILSDYAPHDPWIHSQLAYSYHDLGMPEEEIKALETILSLCPQDKDNLLKLGVLYFQQGHNAMGLQVYEKLKNAHFKKAESLIIHYGNCKTT